MSEHVHSPCGLDKCDACNCRFTNASHCEHCFHCIACSIVVWRTCRRCAFSPNPEIYWRPPFDMIGRFSIGPDAILRDAPHELEHLLTSTGVREAEENDIKHESEETASRRSLQIRLLQPGGSHGEPAGTVNSENGDEDEDEVFGPPVSVDVYPDDLEPPTQKELEEVAKAGFEKIWGGTLENVPGTANLKPATAAS